jgi:NTP pyrophosphatase (non-canonical NTP hydrolase)
LRKFAEECEWNQFHTPGNSIQAIQAELGELSEIVQWIPDSEINEQWIQDNNERLREEIADVFLYLIRLSDVLSIDLINAAAKKIDLNASKYPADLAKGNATKYTHL